MNWLDIIIILFLIGSLFRGRDVGFVRQLCSTAGFFGGLWLGATVVAPNLLPLAHSQLARSLITLIGTLGTAFILLSVGEYLGFRLKNKLAGKTFNIADSIFGAGLAVVTMLLGAWLVASIALSLPSPGLQTEIKGSAIISTLDRALPPAPTVIAGLSHLIDPNGFPEVFTGNEPAPPGNIKLPDLGALQPAVKADEASVVKIEGQGCGGIVEGSGFVIGKQFVVTNAHVIAGIGQPYVLDANGTHDATAVWFDPNLDLAVLRVSNLAGKPLHFGTGTVSQGTPGAVLGYPGGGGFSAKAAAVLDEFTATGRNIYDAGNTKRDVLELKADIIPGNSGGPVINKQGTVIGVVFAESTSYNHVGYALNTPKVQQAVSQAMARNQATSTGSCAAE